MLPTDLLDVIVNGCGLHSNDLASLRLASTTLKAKVDQTLLLLRPACDLSNLRLVPNTFRVLSCFDMSSFDLRLLSSSQLLASSGGLTRHLALTLSQLPCLTELVISEAFAREMGRKCWAAAVCNSIFKDVVSAEPPQRQKQSTAVALPAGAQPAMVAASAEASSSSSMAAASSAADAQRDVDTETVEQQSAPTTSLPSGLSSEHGSDQPHQQRWHSEEEQEELLCHLLNPGPSCLLDCPRELMWTSGFRTFDVVQFRISPASPLSSCSQSLSPTPASCSVTAACNTVDQSEGLVHTSELPSPGKQSTQSSADDVASELQQQLRQLCWPEAPILLDDPEVEDPATQSARCGREDHCSCSCAAAESEGPSAAGAGALSCGGAWGRSESSASCGLLTVQGSFVESAEAADNLPGPGASGATAAGPEPHTPRRQCTIPALPHLQSAAPLGAGQVQPEPQQLDVDEDMSHGVDWEASDLVYFHSAAEDPHANMSAVLWLPDWAANMPQLTSLRIKSDVSHSCASMASGSALPGSMVAGSMTTLLWARRSALARIRSIDLSGTRLGVLPADLLAHCLPPTLRCLRLTGCGLSAIPTSVGSLVQLRELDVASNALRHVPDQLAQLTALSVLDLSNNMLTVLPPCIGACTALERLVLGGNQLRGPSALPLRELASLPLLSCLVLSHNWLALPDAASSASAGAGAVAAAAGRAFGAATAASRITRTSSAGAGQLPSHCCAPLNWLGQLLTGPAASSLTRLDLVNIGPWDQTVCLPWAACLSLTRLQHLDLSQNCGGVQLGPPPAMYRPQFMPPDLGLDLVSTDTTPTLPPIPSPAPASPSEQAEPGAATSASLPLPLPALQYLNISQCGLEELPEALALLPALRTLDVHNNSLAEFPCWMPCLTALHQLRLGGNAELKLLQDSGSSSDCSKWLQGILLMSD